MSLLTHRREPHTHRPGRGTHTVELAQLAEINPALQAALRANSGLHAADLFAVVSGPVPAGAVLTFLSWEGPPGYPYIHAHFQLDGLGEPVSADLHTPELRELSDRLGLRRHVWGV